jgi:hypothetical protein
MFFPSVRLSKTRNFFDWNQQKSTGTKRNQKESKGIKRNQKESKNINDVFLHKNYNLKNL